MTEQALHLRDRNRTRRTWLWVALGLLALFLVFEVGKRWYDARQLAETSREQAIPVVRWQHPAAPPATDRVALPGSVRGVAETDIYARTSGYLKRWRVDIGASVTAGQVLAEIDTPEIDAQWRQAQADLATARANSALADVTAKRWRALLASDSVARQEADEKIADAEAKRTIVASSEANLARLRDLESFKNVTAPFAGIVTARGVDNGALISAGSGSTATSLFHLSDPTRLLVDVAVPQNYVASVRSGGEVSVLFPEVPDAPRKGVIARTADGLDPASRALKVQIEIDNKDRSLLPGGYAEVRFTIAAPSGSLRIPGSALIFDREGVRVAVVGKDNKAVFKRVVAGRDFGPTIEILSGLAADDRVIVNPPDALSESQELRIAEPDAKQAPDRKG